ncbi:MAG: septum formation initiator family protein [Eubacteriales bacterium]|nr:septum formation initiator family protein [Eubacteriales bacterium]
MKKSNANQTKIRRLNNGIGMIVIGCIVSILLAWLVMQSNSMEAQLAGYNAKAEALEEEIEQEKARTEEIDELKAYMETDEYVEDAARERLGLVKDNEIVFEEEK